MTFATGNQRYGSRVSKRIVDESASAILDAARALLEKEGQEALTIRRIAAAAGGSTMNVYSRFGGKDGVIDALLIEGFEALSGVIHRIHATVDPLADLERCAQRYREFALAHRSQYELMFDRAIPGYEISERAKQTAAAALQALSDRVERAMDTGIIRIGDPMHTATMFWSACHGPVSLEMKFVGDPSTNWGQVHRGLMNAVINGLRAEPDVSAGN